jgi:molybdopterin synthase sulfur carrier subunit
MVTFCLTYINTNASGYDAGMPNNSHFACVTFAASLQRHIPCAPQNIKPASLREVLKTALLAAPDLSHYVFDDQGNIRKHVAVFINRDMLQNRTDLTQILKAGDQVLVVQALTGG